MARPHKPLPLWFAEKALMGPEAEPFEDVLELDAVAVADGRAVYAQFYGEAPRVSGYAGTEGELLVGHIHLASTTRFESFLPTMGGEVLRVVTDLASGDVLEGPRVASRDEQDHVIELLTPHFDAA